MPTTNEHSIDFRFFSGIGTSFIITIDDFKILLPSDRVKTVYGRPYGIEFILKSGESVMVPGITFEKFIEQMTIWTKKDLDFGDL